MKKLCVRLSPLHAQSLRREAEMQGINGSEYLRGVIEQHRQKPHFFEYFTDRKIMPSDQPRCRHLNYLIMSCKLLEQLVLNQQDGPQKRETAYEAVIETLTQLKLEPNRTKPYKLTVMLSDLQWGWLSQQAQSLQKPVVSIIRKIVAISYQETRDSGQPPPLELTTAEQAGIKASLMAFTLLKSYVESVYQNSQTLVNHCEKEAEALYQKLYTDPAQTPEC